MATSVECDEGESCTDPSHDRCPNAAHGPKHRAAACATAGQERCLPMGMRGGGESCLRHTDCLPDHLCVGLQVGVCRQRCDFTTGQCPPGQVCLDLMPELPTPDNLGYCAGLGCDPFRDAGCPSGLACYGGARPSCGSPGTAGEGEACKQSTDCLRGLLCVPGLSACARLCDTRAVGIAAGCGANEPCEALLAGGRPLSNHQGYCLGKCDLVTDEGCAPEARCMPKSPPRCVHAGPVPIGGACVTLGDCARGATCVMLSDKTARCARKCDPTAPGACAPGHLCQPLPGDYPTPLGTCLPGP